ncbi:polysaccharide deacetylase family protein [Cohnella suwonensis]|uniref:Polysaccharide deacetylase family protein n=1 Tax=Cohnella suwonensis TaxID=696072 RepID=A0ABW0LPI5_9BACL
MNRHWIAANAAALMLLLTACGNAAQNGESSPSATAPAVTQEASASPPGKAGSPSAEPTPSAKPSASAEPSEPATPAATEKTYKMNKNYFIVPIDKERTENKVVLLTFDDGPKAPETLDPLLDTLDKHGAKAIFFVNGYRVKAHPELLKQIADRGQIIGNHSWDHIDLKKEKAANVEKQIGDVQAIVKETTGQSPVFFRPPFGSGGDEVRKVAKENGLLYMTWSNGSLDWAMAKTPEEKRPQAVIDNVLEQLHPGSNILMHELAWTGKALDSLLDQLEAKGYSFVDPNAIDTALLP